MNTFTIGEWLSRQFGEAVKRTARPLTWIGVPAPEVGTAGTFLRTADPGKDQAVERRLRDRRAECGRRRSDSFAPVGETPRLLLIEPHEDTRLLYACLFEEAGYAVYPLAEGIGAIDIVRGRLPDVVVMELAVPGADGFEILRQLREDPLTSSIPAVVVTSLLNFDVPERARASGAVLVLGKPTGPETLLAAVDELIMATPRERLVVRQLRRSLLTLRELGKRVKPEESAQERVRALIDRLQVAMLALDAQGHYVAVSRGASTLTGYSRAELLGRSIFDAGLTLNPPASERWQEFLAQQRFAAETKMRDRNGNIVSIQTEFATILPGLHAAAFAGQNTGRTANPSA